jgi:hypothetical protein
MLPERGIFFYDKLSVLGLIENKKKGDADPKIQDNISTNLNE